MISENELEMCKNILEKGGFIQVDNSENVLKYYNGIVGVKINTDKKEIAIEYDNFEPYVIPLKSKNLKQSLISLSLIQS